MSKSKINANLPIRGGLLGDHIVAKQAHEVPPGGVLAYRHGCDLGGLRYLARPSNGQRFAHLRQLKRPSIPLKRACRVLRRLWAILLLEFRVAGAFSKEVGECGLQVAKRLLDGDAGHFVEPSVFGLLFERRKCRRSFVVSDALLPLHPCIRPKTKHVVVSKASAAERLGKNHFLLRCRIEPELVRSLYFHSHSILDLCKDGQPNGGCESEGTLRVPCYPYPAFMPGSLAQNYELHSLVLHKRHAPSAVVKLIEEVEYLTQQSSGLSATQAMIFKNLKKLVKQARLEIENVD